MNSNLMKVDKPSLIHIFTVFVQLDAAAKSFHNEVKLASPPFWGSTLFVSIPLGITNANAKKKCEKGLLRKKLNAFFGAAPGFEPATL